jgi:CheY-like chemotaxis protein
MSSLLYTTAGMLGFAQPSRTIVGEILAGVALMAALGFLLRARLAELVEYLICDFQVWLSESHMRNVLMPVYTADSPGPADALDTPAPFAEDEELAKLKADLFPGEKAKEEAPAQSPGAPEPAAKEKPAEEVDPLKEFFSWLPERLARLRDLHQRFSRSDAPHELLRGLSTEIGALRERACLPELVPVRQMSTGLEGLVKQMSDRFHEVTPSTLRTVANGIDLLYDLCTPGLKADVATEPPIRLLAVDDDPISRVAVTFALKKAFEQPDLASDGEEALVLATREAYDVIFLDVQMPGMDGFELCSKIRLTEINKVTPVVFVTMMKDFDARAKSVVSGGNDLIGKPFLPFEITVKALTFALRRRLTACGIKLGASEAAVAAEAAQEATKAEVSPAPTPAKVESSSAKTDSAPTKVDAAPAQEALPEKKQATAPEAPPPAAAAPVPVAPAAATSKTPAEPSPEALRAAALDLLAKFREQFELIAPNQDESARLDMLAGLYVDATALTLNLNSRALRPAFQVSTVLESLLKKIHDKPANATPSVLKTVETAIDLLKDLCLNDVEPRFADQPAISILVVDDDLLTRRAITGALQMAFLKPDNVGDGESAVARALDKHYDVVFMDVQMPGMDGFEACAKIRETAGNRETPVVFVTSQTDFKSRERSTQSGGSDYVTKPFLFQELNLKALTFALRGRLQKHVLANAD